MNYTGVLENLLNTFSVAQGRIRASLLRARGAALKDKVTIGKNCRFDKPWCVNMGRRTRLEDNVFMKIVNDQATCSIGDRVFIGTGVELNVQTKLVIGSNVLIAPGVFIIDHNHQIDANIRINQQACSADSVTIKDDVWIGANAVILPGVTIHQGAVVGAGAIVTKDVESMTIVAGNPATMIGERRSGQPNE